MPLGPSPQSHARSRRGAETPTNLSQVHLLTRAPGSLAGEPRPCHTQTLKKVGKRDIGAIVGKISSATDRCHSLPTEGFGPHTPVFKLLKCSHVSRGSAPAHKPSCFSLPFSQNSLFPSKRAQPAIRLLHIIAGTYVTAKFYPFKIQTGKTESQKPGTS